MTQTEIATWIDTLKKSVGNIDESWRLLRDVVDDINREVIDIEATLEEIGDVSTDLSELQDIFAAVEALNVAVSTLESHNALGELDVLRADLEDEEEDAEEAAEPA
jgi:uncharacterized protein YoxC